MRVQCPCGKGIKVPDHLAGKKFRCPACSKVLLAQVEAVIPKEDEDEPEEEEVAPPPKAKQKARRESKENGEGEERSATKTKGKKGSKKGKKTGPSPVLILVLVLVGVGVLGGGGLTVYFLTRPAKSPQNPNPVANNGPRPGQPPVPGGVLPQGQPPVPTTHTEQHDPEEAPKRPVVKNLTPELKTTGENLIKEVMADEKAAKAKYQGKIIEVEGGVRKASGFLDSFFFSLFAGQGQLGTVDVSCYPNETDQDRLLWFGRGQKVSVVGRVMEISQLQIAMGDCMVTEKGPNPTPQMTAEQLAAEFAKDEMAAKKKYGYEKAHPSDVIDSQKEIIVSGAVADLAMLDGDFGKQAVAILAGSDGMTVTCWLTQKAWESLKKGDKVTIKGEVDTGILNMDKKTVRIAYAFLLKK